MVWWCNLVSDIFVNIGSSNGFSPVGCWCQFIIWTNAVLLTIKPEGKNCKEILIEIHFFFFRKCICKFCSGLNMLTHWGRMMHICVGKLTIIGSDNGLSPGWRRAIIWTNARILLIWPLGTNFNEILIGIQTFSFKKMRLKMSSAKWRPFCHGLNMLIASCPPDTKFHLLVKPLTNYEINYCWVWNTWVN